MKQLIDKDALAEEIEKRVALLFENNNRIYDAYGNYFYKSAENDYRFYHKLDEDNWDEDRLTLTDVTEYLFHLNTLKVKELDLENSMVCKVDWYDGFLLDYTQEQQDELLGKIGANIGDKIRVILIKE